MQSICTCVAVCCIDCAHVRLLDLEFSQVGGPQVLELSRLRRSLVVSASMSPSASMGSVSLDGVRQPPWGPSASMGSVNQHADICIRYKYKV